MGETQRYTRADVAERHGRGDAPLWIIVRDTVYDVTSYEREHPGGVDALREAAGKDSTRDFDDVGHSSDAKTVISKYKIGELCDEDKHYDANGKKKKRVVEDQPKGNSRSCISVVSCGLLG